MFVHLGTQMYGKVDQVPGLFHVATKFFQAQFLPLVPLGSYLVMEGKEPKEDKAPGIAIAWSLKSILAAWARVALILGAFVSLLVTVVMIAEEKNKKIDPSDYFFPVGFGLVFLLALYLSYRFAHATPERALELARLAGIEPEALAAYFEHSKAVSKLLEEYDYDQETFDR